MVARCRTIIHHVHGIEAPCPIVYYPGPARLSKPYTLAQDLRWSRTADIWDLPSPACTYLHAATYDSYRDVWYLVLMHRDIKHLQSDIG
jgi:hypothetical protein